MAKAQVGDLIRIINAEGSYAYENGDIVEVVARWDDGEGVEIKSHRLAEEDNFRPNVFDYEYEIHRKAGEEDAPKPPTDAVNPQHYKQGRTEVIDIIEDAVTGADPFEAVCQANVLKYMLRYRHKNGVEDLKKAIWYAEKLIEHLTQK